MDARYLAHPAGVSPSLDAFTLSSGGDRHFDLIENAIDSRDFSGDMLGELLEIIRRDRAKESGDSANHVAFHPSQGQIATLVQLPPNRGCQTWRCLSTPDQCRIGGCDWECIRDHGAVSN